MNSSLTTTFNPSDNKLKRFIRRLRIWWFGRNKPIHIGTVWKPRYFKGVEDYIMIAKVDDEMLMYYHLDTFAILGNFFYCTMKKEHLLRYWEITEWE